MLLVPTSPSSRDLRIIRNLILRNAIWEELGHSNFVQFDEQTGKELRIQPKDLKRMTASGWIQLVQPPKSAQRLDHYELTEEGAAFKHLALRKAPQQEIPPLPLRRSRRA